MLINYSTNKIQAKCLYNKAFKNILNNKCSQNIFNNLYSSIWHLYNKHFTNKFKCSFLNIFLKWSTKHNSKFTV